MAQFGKNLFGSSYFGYTNTLEGVYQTEVIDTDEPFDGTVDVQIKAELPFTTYLGNHKDWIYAPNVSDWKYTGTNSYTEKINTKATFVMSSDVTHIEFNKQVNGSTAKINIIDPKDGSIIDTKTINTSEIGSVEIALPFQMINLEIVNTENKRLEIISINSRVTTLGIEVRSRQEKKEWSEYEKVEMIFNTTKNLWIGSSKELIQQQYIQVRVHLGTSDIDVTPIVDSIILSSGDTSKRIGAGYWSAALNMGEIATEQKTTFKKVTNITYKKDKNDKSEFTLRSTSTKNTFPSKAQIKDDLYWEAETSPYVLYKNTKLEIGSPWSRISLKSNSNSSYVIGFEMSTKEFQLLNTKINSWLYWNDQSFYPTDSSGTSISYRIYENRNDYEKGIPPIYIINSPEKIISRQLSLPAKYLKQNLFVLIELTKLTGKQTPVVDFFDMIADVEYTSPINTGSRTKELSAIDNGNGNSFLEDIDSSKYNWPNNNQVLDENKEFLLNSNRKLTIKYSPLFPNQINLYFDSLKSESIQNILIFKSTEIKKEKLYSQVNADEPLASTKEAPKDRLIFHYGMDGGTVQYPKETNKELLTDFSPDLIKNVKYQFQVYNGWPDESYLVTSPITWEEASELTGSNLEDLKERNKEIDLYENKIPQDIVLILPNNSLNEIINLKFESNNSSFTKKSIWNNLENDKIIAKIPSNKDFGYKEWISEEKIYDGYINPNNIRNPYIRSQKAIYTSNDEYTYIVKENDTYNSIAKDRNVNPIDLEKKNNSKELIIGEELIIPSSFALPFISPEVIYENRNPYIVEIIPFSVKDNEGTILDIEEIILGSDSEEVLQYTYQESEPVTNELKRGTVLNGRDVLFYSNPNRVLKIVDSKSGYIYQPYSKAANGTETGDFILKEGYIDWSPAHPLAKEPKIGDLYKVTYTYDVVDNLRITMTSDYLLKSGFNKLWKSPEIKEIEGIVTPEKDFIYLLPKANEFLDYNNNLTDVEYLVEDNDLWVKTSIRKDKENNYIVGTMNGEDPKRNWYPTINTGFYYLAKQEYYLYSSALEHNFSEEALPIIKNVSYINNGIKLNSKRSNLILDSSMKSQKLTKIK